VSKIVTFGEDRRDDLIKNKESKVTQADVSLVSMLNEITALPIEEYLKVKDTDLLRQIWAIAQLLKGHINV
jgi:hypothetical protein